MFTTPRPPLALLPLFLFTAAFLLQECGPASQPATPAPAATSTTASVLPVTDTPELPTAVISPTVAAPSPTPTLPGDPARGAKLFNSLPCQSCHDVTHPLPGGEVCPNLGNIATEAARIVRSPEYHGRATDAASYIRESIMNPNAYIVPGEKYHQADGQSVMPKDFAKLLKPEEIDDLVAFLMTRQ